MKGEWRISSTYAGGKYYYQVFRLRDVKAIDHAGNREVVFTSASREEAEKELKRRQEDEKQQSFSFNE